MLLLHGFLMYLPSVTSVTVLWFAAKINFSFPHMPALVRTNKPRF
jgi:hypothetical protein